jgi:hypothetical protein
MYKSRFFINLQIWFLNFVYYESSGYFYVLLISILVEILILHLIDFAYFFDNKLKLQFEPNILKKLFYILHILISLKNLKISLISFSRLIDLLIRRSELN